MPEKKVSSLLNEWFIRLSQSINIEYLALVDEKGKIYASAGNLGLINRVDTEDLLKTYYNQPDHLSKPGDVNEVRIIKKGAVECISAPINGIVQLLAVASIERPSVLIRGMLNEVQAARVEITAIVEKEWKIIPKTTGKIMESKRQPPIKGQEVKLEGKKTIPLEELIAQPQNEMKKRDAGKYWDNARIDDQQITGQEKTISFDEAKRSGLVPEEKS